MDTVFLALALSALFVVPAHGEAFGDPEAVVSKICDNSNAVENQNVALLCKIKGEMVEFLKAENPTTDAIPTVLNLLNSAKKLDIHKVSFLNTLMKTMGGLSKVVEEIVKEKHRSNRSKKGTDDLKFELENLLQLPLDSKDDDIVQSFLEAMGNVIVASESIFKLVHQNPKYAKVVEEVVSVMNQIVQGAKNSTSENSVPESSSKASVGSVSAVTEKSDSSEVSGEITYPVWSVEGQNWINLKPEFIARPVVFSKNLLTSVKQYFVKWTKPYGPYGSFYYAAKLNSQ